MRITEMAFEKKILTGQYEHEMLKVVVAVAESESNPSARVKELVSFVQTRGDTKLEGAATVVTTQVGGASDTTESVKSEEVKEAKETKKDKKASKKDAEVKADEKAETAAEEKTEEKAEVKTLKTKKSVAYSRTNETHKKLVGELLDSRYAGWRTNPNKYVEASKKLEGQDLLNDEGLILDSFKEKFDAEVK
jgi:hypothetical protein